MNILPHAHCEICQTTVEVGERFCGSPECDEKHKANVREKRKQMAILVGVLGLAMILYAIR